MTTEEMNTPKCNQCGKPMELSGTENYWFCDCKKKATDELMALKDTPEDNHKLRQKIALLLNPGPREHDLVTGANYCKHCYALRLQTDGDGHIRYPESFTQAWNDPCVVPPLAEGSFADLAERMKTMVGHNFLHEAIHDVYHQVYGTPCLIKGWRWLWERTSREQCIIILVAALQEAQ